MEAAFYHTFLSKLSVPAFVNLLEPSDNQINSDL